MNMRKHLEKRATALSKQHTAVMQKIGALEAQLENERKTAQSLQGGLIELRNMHQELTLSGKKGKDKKGETTQKKSGRQT